MLRRLQSELGELVFGAIEVIVRRVRNTEFIANLRPRRAAGRNAADGVHAVDEGRVIQHAGAAGNSGFQKQPLDRRWIHSDAVDASRFDKAAAFGFPRRPAVMDAHEVAVSVKKDGFGRFENPFDDTRRGFSRDVDLVADRVSFKVHAMPGFNLDVRRNFRSAIVGCKGVRSHGHRDKGDGGKAAGDGGKCQ